jgi:hypothetical protein
MPRSVSAGSNLFTDFFTQVIISYADPFALMNKTQPNTTNKTLTSTTTSNTIKLYSRTAASSPFNSLKSSLSLTDLAKLAAAMDQPTSAQE